MSDQALAPVKTEEISWLVTEAVHTVSLASMKTTCFYVVLDEKDRLKMDFLRLLKYI